MSINRTLGRALAGVSAVLALVAGLSFSPQAPAEASESGLDDSHTAYLAREYGLSEAEAEEWAQYSYDSPAAIAEIRNRHARDYGGYQLDYANRRITVYAVNPSPDLLAGVAAKWPRMFARMRVEEVRYSLENLELTVDRLLRTNESLPEGDRFSVRVDDPENVVVLRKPTWSAESRDRIHAEHGDRVRFEDGPVRRMETASCTYPTRCAPPARGGIRYGRNAFDSTEYSCTGAFVSRNTAGSWYMMTAGHCFWDGQDTNRYQNTYDSTGASVRRKLFGVPSNGWQVGDRVDGARGFIDASGVDFWKPSRWVYYSSSAQSFQIQSKIGTLLSMPIGALICRGGGRSGTDCGEVSSRTESGTTEDPFGTVRSMRWSVGRSVCTRTGDSGGPIYSYQSSQGVAASTAYGVVSAREVGTDDVCPWGDELVFFSPTYAIEGALAIHVWCGGTSGPDPAQPGGCRTY